MNYREKECFNVISFPEGFFEENRGLKECCKYFDVLADISDDTNYKNDIRGIVVKASDPADVVDFVIRKCDDYDTILTNHGEVGVFPQDENARGFIYNWREYLTLYGAGTYEISISFTISGVSGGYVEGLYKVTQYSIATAHGTVRVWSEFNSYFQKKLIDFTNSNFKDSIRFGGFFGNRSPETQINNLITKGRKVEKVTRENLNSYELRTDPLCIQITQRLVDFMFLNEDVTLISDHNQANHDYNIFDKNVVLEEAIEENYRDGSRLADIVAKFGDRKKLDKSYYNVQ